MYTRRKIGGLYHNALLPLEALPLSPGLQLAGGMYRVLCYPALSAPATYPTRLVVRQRQKEVGNDKAN